MELGYLSPPYNSSECFFSDDFLNDPPGQRH